MKSSIIVQPTRVETHIIDVGGTRIDTELLGRVLAERQAARLRTVGEAYPPST